MPVLDTLPDDCELSAQVGHCLSRKAFANSKDLILNKGTDGIRFSEPTITTHTADQAGIATLDL
ncbi:MAG: hypothetical protein OEY07_15165, partial [Gammaproteobacteria bacterium]|nr:hypothetical protein [Gammaproteobacteria bacterium]